MTRVFLFPSIACAGILTPFSLNFLSDAYETGTESEKGGLAGNRGFELVRRKKEATNMKNLVFFVFFLISGLFHGRHRVLNRPGHWGMMVAFNFHLVLCKYASPVCIFFP